MAITQNRAYVQCNITLFLMYLSAPIPAIMESKFLSLGKRVPAAVLCRHLHTLSCG